MNTAAVVHARVDPAAADIARRTIPFDHTLRFAITRQQQAGDLLQGKVQVSVEAPFVAVGIGYGFVAEGGAKDFGIPPAAAVPPGLSIPAVAGRRDVLETALDALDGQLRAAPLGNLSLAGVLRNGFRINPRYVAQLLPRSGGKLGFNFAALGPTLPEDLFQALLPPPEQLQFLYALHDQGSGRAFQSEPVLSTAGLGSPDGQRPFRPFAAPVRLAPNTTLRIDLILLQPVLGELHFALHGYKVLGTPGTPTDLVRIARRAAQRRVRR
jgi:hypothetical protein